MLTLEDINICILAWAKKLDYMHHYRFLEKNSLERFRENVSKIWLWGEETK